MRVLFAGSPSFSVPSLEALQQSHTVCGVLTNPDRPAGRRRELSPTAVKARALELNLKVLQPAAFDPEFLEAVRALRPDLLAVVSFGRIFKADFLDLFPKGAVNVHPSLLPKFRGPAPIPAAIMAGEAETGVTVQRLALKMDSGGIIKVHRHPLNGTETAETLYRELFRAGADLLVEAVDMIAAGTARFVAQKEEEASYSRMLKKSDGRIDWGRDAAYLERMLRAYLPWPGCYTGFQGRQLDLLAGGVYPGPARESKEKGRVLGIDKNYGILVNTGNGVLYVSRLKLQAKKALSWRQFLNGQNDFLETQLGG
jgi:methionyl-tRNA formyltransferase